MQENTFVWYAKKYNCTIAEAIADRDHPATRATLIQWFTEAAGRAPTEAEITTMRPNTAGQVREEVEYLSR